MIEQMVQMFVRFACDHCGRVQKRYHEKLDAALSSAVAEGFVISEWLHEGCARQTCFCKACAEEAANVDGG